VASPSAAAAICGRRKVLEAVGEAIIAIDLSGCVTFWNQAAERLYGRSAAEAIGKRSSS